MNKTCLDSDLTLKVKKVNSLKLDDYMAKRLFGKQSAPKKGCHSKYTFLSTNCHFICCC